MMYAVALHTVAILNLHVSGCCKRIYNRWPEAPITAFSPLDTNVAGSIGRAQLGALAASPIGTRIWHATTRTIEKTNRVCVMAIPLLMARSLVTILPDDLPLFHRSRWRCLIYRECPLWGRLPSTVTDSGG